MRTTSHQMPPPPRVQRYAPTSLEHAKHGVGQRAVQHVTCALQHRLLEHLVPLVHHQSGLLFLQYAILRSGAAARAQRWPRLPHSHRDERSSRVLAVRSGLAPTASVPAAQWVSTDHSIVARCTLAQLHATRAHLEADLLEELEPTRQAGDASIEGLVVEVYSPLGVVIDVSIHIAAVCHERLAARFELVLNTTTPRPLSGSSFKHQAP